MKRALLGLMLILAACAPTGSGTSTTAQLPPNVEVTFNVLTPASTPAGEGVSLVILDTVTGLEFNPQSQAMQPGGERSFTTTLSVPAGTLLKYRYIRETASGPVNEATANGEGVEFRAYLVDGPGHIAHDVIAAWADLAETLDTGTVVGSVLDAVSGNPLPGVTVVAAGLETETDVEGKFTIGGLPQGLHNIVVFSKQGSHMPFQQGALVAANGQTPAEIRVAPALYANVTFLVTPPAEHTPSTPIFLVGDLNLFSGRALMALQSDGRYALTLQLPVGIDMRYKYTQGDGLWNAEHNEDGSFATRQLIVPANVSPYTVEDGVASWSAGSSAPIWFELTAPAQGPLVYMQFNLGGWTTPLPMWPLSEGHWAYKLHSPTNFADVLEYRYCLDAACTILEAAPGAPRTVTGNQPELQQINDQIHAWQQ
jgi:hypothetical protein